MMADEHLLRPRSAWRFLVVIATATAAAAAIPVTAPLLSIIVIVSLPAAIVVGMHRNRPRLSLPWAMFATATALASVSAVVRTVTVDGEAPFALFAVSNVLSLTAYVLDGLALFVMLRARGEQGSEGAIADGALVAVAGALLVGTFLTLPALMEGTAPVGPILAGLYPVLSVVLAFLGLRLLLAGTRRQASVIGLVVAVFSVLIGDLLYALNDSGTTVDLRAADLLYGCAAVAVAFAALHPSMRTLTEPSLRRLRPLGPARLVTLAIALSTPTAVAVVAGATESIPARVLLAAAGASLVVLATTRIARAVNTHATSEARLAHLATRDPLTDLPNRIAVGEYLALCLQDAPVSGQGVSVLFMDLDRFKHVNDTWGHKVGDLLLVDVATRLRAAVRNQDLVARVGGDEFVVICSDLTCESEAVEVGIRLLESFQESFTLPFGQMSMSASLGVAYDSGQQGTAAEDLIRMADTAMYRAKDLGRGTVATFDDSMRHAVTRRIELEAALQRALERNEMWIAYQPIVDMVSGETVAFEALMRWNSEQLGSVTPAEFIPVAEDTGLIRPLGAWVMRESTAQLGRWQRAGATDIALSVNLSACQLDDPATAQMVLDAVHDAGVPPHSVWVEITESVMVSEALHAEATLQHLRAEGLHLAADDFGTGYSSLSYLKRFPFDHVKIDRCFVSGLGRNSEDEGIVSAVLAMGEALDLVPVAEGIETELQRDRLVALGCRFAQGYLFDRPLTVVDATNRLGLNEASAPALPGA